MYDLFVNLKIDIEKELDENLDSSNLEYRYAYDLHLKVCPHFSYSEKI